MFTDTQKTTHTAPIDRIHTTETFVLGFIFKPQTMKTGMMLRTQSPRQLTAEYPYVTLTVIRGSIQVPFPPVYCVQKYADGRHCKMKRKKKNAE